MDYRGCQVPEDLYYDVENQVWYRVETDGSVIVGATDIGQTRAGRMVNVRIKPVGKHVPKGKPYSSLESGKWTGPVPAMIQGVVIERNEDLFDQPDLINDFPYTKGWIVKIKPDNLEEDIKSLVTGEEALRLMKEYIDREGVECKRD